ncbi:MAG: HAD-IB family phosphatase [Deltaproteobacteria bacterium]|nr:HAD-IB family phosphatase [Deltaproteobacteria bacterium]
MKGLIELLCDFDGTVALEDTVDLLLEQLADPAWRILEERWVRGEIDSRECMAGQIPLIQGGWAAIRRILEGARVDPTFAGFAVWCRRRGIRLRIVSGGIDRVIHYLLAREGITVDEIWAPHLVEDERGRLTLDFPASTGRTRCGSTFCKCELFAGRMPRPLRILVGDGRSDFCCARQADWIFARDTLITHCRAQAIDFLPFEDFAEIRRILELRVLRPSGDKLRVSSPSLTSG